VIVTANTAELYANHPSQQRLAFHLQIFNNLRARSQILDSRLRNEISLVGSSDLKQTSPINCNQVFNLVTLRDSNTNVRIRAAVQRDNAAMKTISLVTMALLPATVVSVSTESVVNGMCLSCL
jgi:hypothetical protein